MNKPNESQEWAYQRAMPITLVKYNQLSADHMRLVRMHDSLVKIDKVDCPEGSELYHLVESIRAQLTRITT